MRALPRSRWSASPPSTPLPLSRLPSDWHRHSLSWNVEHASNLPPHPVADLPYQESKEPELRSPQLPPQLSAMSPTATNIATKAAWRRLCLIPLVWLWNVVLLLEGALCMQCDRQDEHRVQSAVRKERSAHNHASESDNDNDNDTLREVPHPSNEGLALQARVGVMTPRKRICCADEACSLARYACTDC